MTNVPSQYQADVNNAAKATGLPAAVVAAQINEESGFQTGVSSSAGAEGIAQFEPATWAALGCTGSPFNASDAFNCYDKYMKQLLGEEGGSVQKALEAYNAGPGNLSAGAGYADTILNDAKQGLNITAGGSSSSGASTTSLLGDLNPADWGAALEKDVVVNPTEKMWNWVLNALGVKSLTDLLERGALIVMGTILLIMGIHSLMDSSSTGSEVKKAAGSAAMGAATGAIAA